MWSFEPLQHTLLRLGLKLSDLQPVLKSSRTIAKIRKNESVTLETLDKIADFLEVEDYKDIIERRRL